MGELDGNAAGDGKAEGSITNERANAELEGRVALLTGAGSLLGGAIAGKLVDAGAKVIMAGRIAIPRAPRRRRLLRCPA